MSPVANDHDFEPTDNKGISDKLTLRRYLLDKYHCGGKTADVLDCCQGDGVLWGKLKTTHKPRRYMGVDVKPRRGRIKIDSAKLLMTSFSHNFIDVDMHGAPWRHWFFAIQNATQPTTFALTHGRTGVQTGGSPEALAAMGLTVSVPKTLGNRLAWDVSLPYCLAAAEDYGWKIVEAVSVGGHTNCKFIGVRIERADG